MLPCLACSKQYVLRMKVDDYGELQEPVERGLFIILTKVAGMKCGPGQVQCGFRLVLSADLLRLRSELVA